MDLQLATKCREVPGSWYEVISCLFMAMPVPAVWFKNRLYFFLASTYAALHRSERLHHFFTARMSTRIEH